MVLSKPDDKKVAFIAPYCNRDTGIFPLGILYIATVLKKVGYSITMIDTNHTSIKQIVDIVKDTRFVCFSICSQDFFESIKLMNIIKKHHNNKIFIAGGPHPTLFCEETIKNEFDYAVIGEGEDTINELFMHFQGKKDISNIKGICYRRGSKIITNQGCNLIEDLDRLPFPDYGLLDLEVYRKESDMIFRINSTRGCPGDCSFCSPIPRKLYGNKMRQRSPENVAEEISKLVSEHRARNFYFVDDNFALNPRWILRFCELIIKKQLEINWFIQARINKISININTLRSMKRAGCHNILFGVESGSKRILDYYNKNILIEDTIKIFDECHRIGINTHAFLIIGAPIEDKDDLEKTVRLIWRISPDSILISRLTANPGTRLYDELKEEGIINYEDYDESFNSRYPLSLKYLDESDLDFYEKKINRVFFFARLKNRLMHPINKIIFPMIDRFCCSSFL